MKGTLWEMPGAIDRLRVLWSDGHSASRISVMLLNEFGVRVSRNAVLAKVQRLNLPARRTRRSVTGSIWEKPGAQRRLRALWAENYSASQIAHLLTSEFDIPVTRSGIIGKVHRLRLDQRRRGQRGVGRRKAVAASVKARETCLEIGADAPDAVRRTVMTVTDAYCRWPIKGDDEPFQMCGAAVAKGCGPYCTYHRQKAWQPGTSLNGRKKPNGGGFTPFYGNASLNFTTGASS
jgi:hypothetical protein